MSFNPNLTYFVERLQGISVNTFRLETQNQTTAKSGQIVSFDLPSNAIINLRSLKVWCNATANAGAAAAGGRLPPINELVERVEVSVGGIVLSQGTMYVNILNAIMKALDDNEYDDAVTGHPEIVRQTSYVDGSTYAATANEDYSTLYDGVTNLFCIDKFKGFISSADPKLIDTSILPDCRVRLYLAEDAVCMTTDAVGIGDGAAESGALSTGAGLKGFCNANGPGGVKFQLSDLHATIEVIGLASTAYDAMLSAQMSQAGFLEIPYKDYTSFQNVHDNNGSTRFTVSTQSLDRVWVAWRKNNFDQRCPVIVNGYKKQGGFITGEFVGTVQDTRTTRDIGLPQYDVGGVLGTNEEKYLSQYFNFYQGDNSGMKMQLQLNGAYLPQFPANLGELYGMTKNSLPASRKCKQITFDQYLYNYCVQAFRLNLPDSEYSRTISGLDTRAVNLQAVVKTTDTVGATTKVCNIFTESTSTLRVGPGRSVEVIA